jgi:hypothetical protein
VLFHWFVVGCTNPWLHVAQTSQSELKNSKMCSVTTISNDLLMRKLALLFADVLLTNYCMLAPLLYYIHNYYVPIFGHDKKNSKELCGNRAVRIILQIIDKH